MERVPTPVNTDALTEAQRAGWACVWCGGALTRSASGRWHVGWTGRPSAKLWGCRDCVMFKHRRLPTFPEYGSV